MIGAEFFTAYRLNAEQTALDRWFSVRCFEDAPAVMMAFHQALPAVRWTQGIDCAPAAPFDFLPSAVPS